MNINFCLSSSSNKPTVVALGLFDGVHLAHQKVINTTIEIAQNLDVEPTVLTFTMESSRPAKKQGQGTILTDSLKYSHFDKLGIKTVYAPDFEIIKDYSAEKFVKEILIDKLNATNVVCGYDFHFGSGGKADSNCLSKIARKYGCKVTILSKLTFGNTAISSTRIREFLQNGKIQEANTLLGYDYSFDFVVVSGRQLGRTLGFPTINQQYPDGFVVPKYGVYASVSTILGKQYPSVTNIGIKPTVGAENPLAETYIIGADEDLYGEKILVELKEFLRDETRFPSLEALKSAISENAQQAQSIFEKTH